MKIRALLIGGYEETGFLAQSFIKKGYAVTAVNDDAEECRSLAGIERLTVFQGDGSKPFVLEDANAHNADIAIALTGRDEDSLVICELCKKRFYVKRTVALISDPKKIDFFYRMGIDSVVCAVSAIASIVEQQAFVDEMATLIPIGEGRVRISQVHVSAFAPVANKKLAEINLPKQVIIGCVMRGETCIIPRGDTRIQTGDILVLISALEHETAALRELTGTIK